MSPDELMNEALFILVTTIDEHTVEAWFDRFRRYLAKATFLETYLRGAGDSIRYYSAKRADDERYERLCSSTTMFTRKRLETIESARHSRMVSFWEHTFPPWFWMTAVVALACLHLVTRNDKAPVCACAAFTAAALLRLALISILAIHSMRRVVPSLAVFQACAVYLAVTVPFFSSNTSKATGE